jgi:hypothetical protein
VSYLTDAIDEHVQSRTPTLANDQRRFLALHARHLVTSWRWFMSESQMLAETDGRARSWISRTSLVELVHRGLVKFTHGQAVALTDAGREQVERDK